MVKNEHYCEKWRRLGNESPPGFDYPPQIPQQLDTELFVSPDEQSECRQWLASRELDPDKPDSDPDIRYITASRVLTSWLDLK